METIYTILSVATGIAGVIGFISFVLFMMMGFDDTLFGAISLVCLVIVIGLGVAKINITIDETTVLEETVVATVTSKDMVADENSNKCYVAIICDDDSDATLWVTHNEYARVQVGDNVSVIKTAETLFGNTVYSYEIVI